MGVHGLWKLIEPAGKPVPLESLENKVLAVDVSIWLYQLTKGMHTAGGTMPNAHLLGLFNRICKLLYYRIKPVFVFDGSVPLLKRETIEARKRQKRKAQESSEQLREKLLSNLLKQKAVNQLLQNEDIPTSSYNDVDDMFLLPPLPEKETNKESDQDSDTEVNTAKVESFCAFQYGTDMHSIDINSDQFKSLPPEIRHEILSEIVETRKQNSWAKIHEMPENADDFSAFQMKRLRKRRDVQASLDDAAKEMGGRTMTFSELETMLQEDGIVTESLPGKRIASDNTTRYIYVTSQSKEQTELEKTPSDEKEKNEDTMSKLQKEKASVSKDTEESRFHSSVQAVEEYMFLHSFSSEDEAEIVQDSSEDEGGMVNATENEYVELLSSKETISQEEILAIIRRESNKKDEKCNNEFSRGECSKMLPGIDHLNEKIVESDHNLVNHTEDYSARPSTSTFTPAVSSENDNGSLGSQEVNSSRKETHGNSKSQEINSSVVILNNDSDNKSVDYECSESSMEKKFLENEENLDRRKDLDQESVELSHDSTSDDDFVEVPNLNDSYPSLEVSNKILEISIDPNKLNDADDIFSGIFKSENNNSISTDATDRLEKKDVTYDKPENGTNKATMSDGISSVFFPSVTQSVKTFSIPDGTGKDETLSGVSLETEDCRVLSQGKDYEPTMKVAVEVSSKSMHTVKNYQTDVVKQQVCAKQEQNTENLSDILNKIQKSKVPKNDFKTQETSHLKRDRIPDRDELLKTQKILNEEELELLNERGKQERLGSTITQQMIIEAQELLQLFGLPYVMAPMEAEAQCAFLDQTSLTEGTITDDSDIWLFGGQKVYKNFFDNKKYVLQFRSVDIKHFFKLSRNQLIQMALLVGSDYTVGVEGIGAVTALEIVAYFSDKSEDSVSEKNIAKTLKQFQMWIKNNRNNHALPLMRKLKNVSLSESFPNISVIKAYLTPNVDESRDTFTWATPDLDRIRLYMKSKFGWKSTRIDDILLPVMKRLMNKNKQTTLDNYFKVKSLATIEYGTVSKRVLKAINVMKSKSSENMLSMPSTSKSPAKSTGKSPVKSAAESAVKSPVKNTEKSPAKSPYQATKKRGNPSPATTPKKPRKSPKASAVSNMKALSPNKVNPFFSNFIPQKEKDKIEAAKRKLEAVQIFKMGKNNKNKLKKRSVLPAKKDSSYLSESSDSES